MIDVSIILYIHAEGLIVGTKLKILLSLVGDGSTTTPKENDGAATILLSCVFIQCFVVLPLSAFLFPIATRHGPICDMCSPYCAEECIVPVWFYIVENLR